MDNIDKVWQSYIKTKSSSAKEKLILKYAHLVKYVAGRVSIRTNQVVEFDDLVSYGIFGLIDAIEKFDSSKDVKFETYASLRIKGAILDALRKLDWVPRVTRQKSKRLEAIFIELEDALGREPTEDELAERLDISLAELREMLNKSAINTIVSLDDYLDKNHEAGFHMDAAPDSANPAALAEQQEVRQILVEAIDKLTDNEKQVIMFYYFEELTLREISSVMGLTESRISQIHSKALMKMQARLGQHRSVLLTL